MNKNGPIALLFNGLIISFMLAPLVIVCLVAFTPGNTLTIPTTEFSLRWFAAVFDHSDFVTAFWNSLWLAIASASLSTAIAIPAGLAITRYQFKGRDALNGLFLSPLIVPHLVLGVALLRLFSLIGATGSFGWLILAHTLIVTPFVFAIDCGSLLWHGQPLRRCSALIGRQPRYRILASYPAHDSSWRNRGLATGLYQQL